jgi:4-hydroxybenzoate polyprenyltransferase
LTSAAAPGFLNRLRLFSGEIRVQESVFALPFAYTGMLLAADGGSTWSQFLWITAAMVSARTLGMSANRIIDRRIDSRNPRTSGRHLASGRLRMPEMVALSAIAAVVFFVAAAMLNTLALALAPVAAAYLVIYPFAKRYTWAASFLLGWALAIAPSAAWIGVRGSLAWEAVLLSTVVALWAASFDILYHAQDFDFYTNSGLHSVARKFGVRSAFRIARTLDVLAIVCLAGLGVGLSLAWPYYIGCAVAAVVLMYKHSMVSPDDLSRMGVAFFRINAYVSLTVFVATMVAVFVF